MYRPTSSTIHRTYSDACQGGRRLIKKSMDRVSPPPNLSHGGITDRRGTPHDPQSSSYSASYHSETLIIRKSLIASLYLFRSTENRRGCNCSFASTSSIGDLDISAEIPKLSLDRSCAGENRGIHREICFSGDKHARARANLPELVL